MPFYFHRKHSCSHWTRDWVNPEWVWIVWRREKISLPLLGIEFGFPDIVTSTLVKTILFNFFLFGIYGI